MAVHTPEPVPADALREADLPLLTYYDDATGERTELTAHQLGGWAARSAGLLRDDCGLRAGDRVAVLLPPHWRTAAVLLGAWAVGCPCRSGPGPPPGCRSSNRAAIGRTTRCS